MNYMANSRSRLVINKTMDFPILRSLLLYSPSHGNKRLGWCMMAVFPLSLPLYFVGTGMQKGLKAELAQSVKVCDELSSMLKD